MDQKQKVLERTYNTTYTENTSQQWMVIQLEYWARSLQPPIAVTNRFRNVTQGLGLGRILWHEEM
jgi:hypothetical protein